MKAVYFGVVVAASVAFAATGQAAEKFKDCADCPEMVVIPAGSFTMGQDDNYTKPSGKKMGLGGPAIQVNIPRPFAMQATEVTQAQWLAFVKETGHKMATPCKNYWEKNKPGTATWEDPIWEDGRKPDPRDPAACIAYADIQAYLVWLNKKKPGRNYTLPNEAQYEYAARAGTTGPFPWEGGADGACKHVNIGDLSYAKLSGTKGEINCDDGYPSMAPVASYPPNAFGVSDLLGNMWEWVNDCGGNESLADYPRDGLTMPKPGGDCPRTRGGSNLSPPYWMTVTIRGGDHPVGTRLNVMGFRVVSNAP